MNPFYDKKGRRYDIPGNWVFCCDPVRSRAWYEYQGRAMFTPVYAWKTGLTRSRPSSLNAERQALKVLKRKRWDRKERWNWFYSKWADLFEGPSEESHARHQAPMGVFFRLPNGEHFHICGRGPEETDAVIEGLRLLIGGDGLIQPRPVETPFDNVNAPLFSEDHVVGGI